MIKHKQYFPKLSLLCLTLSLASYGHLTQADDHFSADELLDLPLDELLSVSITSVSRKEQKLSSAAAAIYVISNEDIKRSGVTNIADALQMAPGIQVARIDANKWAVSSRGNNGRYANKLLVQIDGRSVYSSTFSGVYWDAQDTLLEDIERIEVIRGPGATLWGSNAFNGVINIITKNSHDTSGTYVSIGAGLGQYNHEKTFAQARIGKVFSEKLAGRAYVKYKNINNNSLVDTVATKDVEAKDQWSAMQTGFRLDNKHSSQTN